LNSFPSFANEIRTQIGYAVRSLSIAIWNKQSDIKNAISMINLALKINLIPEVNEKFKKDLIDLSDIEKKYQGLLTCSFCTENTPDDKSGLKKMLYLETASYHRRIEYNKIKLTIPRCAKCRKFHNYIDILFILTFVGMLFLLIYLFKKPYKNMEISQVFILIFFGWLLAKLITEIFARSKRIKFASYYNVKKHPIVLEKTKEGWKLEEPTLALVEMLFNLIIRIYHGIDFIISLLINFIFDLVKIK
jgi:hypothetical protein